MPLRNRVGFRYMEKSVNPNWLNARILDSIFGCYDEERESYYHDYPNTASEILEAVTKAGFGVSPNFVEASVQMANGEIQFASEEIVSFPIEFVKSLIVEAANPIRCAILLDKAPHC